MTAMRWFRAIDCDNTVDDPFVADKFDLDGLDEWDLASGRLIPDFSANAVFWASKPENDGIPDDVLQTAIGFIPVLSKRTRRALMKGRIAGIQYLPVRVVRPSGEEIAGYSAANVLNIVPALDVGRSTLTRFGADYFLPERRGQVQSIEHAVLLANSVAPYDIVRLQEYPVAMYVSDHFRRIFVAEGLTGYGFQEVDVSNDRPGNSAVAMPTRET